MNMSTTTLLTGRGLVESPRWHDGRLYFSDWSAGEVLAALGTIALTRGDTGGAVASWKRAVELGVADADLCYRYAVLADGRGLPVRAALERALALRPDFDDARFKLALLEKNAGHAEAAVDQLRAAGLVKRVQSGEVDEVIMATSPTLVGEATAAWLADALKGSDRGIVLAKFLQRTTPPKMCCREFRIHLEHGIELLDRLVIAARVIVNESNISVNGA